MIRRERIVGFWWKMLAKKKKNRGAEDAERGKTEDDADCGLLLDDVLFDDVLFDNVLIDDTENRRHC